MQQSVIRAGFLECSCTEGNSTAGVRFFNRATGEEWIPSETFSIEYAPAGTRRTIVLHSSECQVDSLIQQENQFLFSLSAGCFRLELDIEAGDGALIHSRLTVTACDPDIKIDKVTYFTSSVSGFSFQWSVPVPTQRVHIPKYIMSLGQPVYLGSFFAGGEFPTCDNKIQDGTARFTAYYGRTFREMAENGSVSIHSCVVGAAEESGYDACHNAFFAYMRAFARPEHFRLQFNSWYDNMLDITSDNIAESFRAVEKGLREHGVRPLDSYVVDDGWVDYKKKAFWAFREERFPHEFREEKKLMEELGAGFGVWFGPRGGYTEAGSYAKNLKKIGYHKCRQSNDICTGSPQYIDALIDRMIGFMREYNVNYFKLDGFSCKACKSKKHGHPAGGKEEKGVYYYSFLWEKWLAGFERLRAVNPDVYLNLTSYSHCSPWFLKWVDAVWLNNSADMYYEGEGSNLDQCLNYRDGRYYDYYCVRQQQFPASRIYNHEPCYGKKNYNPPLPHKSHRTVYYTDEEFTRYLLMCMMRGTGFVELYYSPAMFDGAKWEINARILNWAEENFHILRHSEYFGGIPKNGDCYGYAAFEDGNGFVIVRNPSSRSKKLTVPLKKYSRLTSHQLKTIYPQDGPSQTAGETAELELQPHEIRLFQIAAE